MTNRELAEHFFGGLEYIDMDSKIIYSDLLEDFLNEYVVEGVNKSSFMGSCKECQFWNKKTKTRGLCMRDSTRPTKYENHFCKDFLKK